MNIFWSNITIHQILRKSDKPYQRYNFFQKFAAKGCNIVEINLVKSNMYFGPVYIMLNNYIYGFLGTCTRQLDFSELQNHLKTDTVYL